MTVAGLKAILKKVPNDAEIFVSGGPVNETGEVESCDGLRIGLVYPKTVDYRSGPAYIFTEFDLRGLGLEALREMNSKLGTGITPGVVFH